MPKISDEKRAARRSQILEAAWACFQRQGIHATTMDDIIKASGLSAGAVYSYYASKDELILAAVTASLGALRALIDPILKAQPLPPPDELVRQITHAIAKFTQRDTYDLKRIALLGWSEAQRNEALRATMGGFYRAFREQMEDAARQWKSAGILAGDAVPASVAKTLLAMILGFVVEAAILGDIGASELAAGLNDLRQRG
jgi:AcrR family transcriptional regulator